MEQEPPAVHDEVKQFLDGLVSHYVLDAGKLVVAHAGMKETMQGRGSRAVRDFALGIESLERFVAGEPLRRVHECVFGVLALESEPVDPRL